MLERATFSQMQQQARAALAALDMSLARLAKLHDRAQLNNDILAASELKAENEFFSSEIFSQLIQNSNTDLLQAALDGYRLGREAEELKKRWPAETNGYFEVIEKEFTGDVARIASIDLLERKHTKNQKIIAALTQGLQTIFDLTEVPEAMNASLPRLIELATQQLQNPLGEARKKFTAHFSDLLTKPVGKFGKFGDYFAQETHQAKISNWFARHKTVACVALHRKTQNILDAVKFHSAKVAQIHVNYEGHVAALREKLQEQQEALESFNQRMLECEQKFAKGKQVIVEQLLAEKKFAQKLTEKIARAIGKNQIVREKQERVKENMQTIRIVFIAASGNVDLSWLQYKQKETELLLRETEQEMQLIALHFTEFNDLLAPPALRCRRNKRTCQGSIWKILFEKVREINDSRALLQFKHKSLLEELGALQRNQTFAQRIKQKAAIINVEPPASQVTREQTHELKFFKEIKVKSVKNRLSSSRFYKNFS